MGLYVVNCTLLVLRQAALRVYDDGDLYFAEELVFLNTWDIYFLR